eukprot:TRINITY_DN24090_c0_g1_i1.p1 TRINITY_DN24090_c0_g1~~TRINITY_DN24090_c0_g1_i1.p1  ORF type:complete len:1254 (-),score=254.93 TRINITY_DN24090_c0_g1_i1:136-3897(-)
MSHLGLALESGGDASGMNTISALLQLFDSCSPGEDMMIERDLLEEALAKNLHGSAKIAGAAVFQDLDAPKNYSQMSVDFLHFWRGMECFLSDERQQRSKTSLEQEHDTVRGCRLFRDGVLQLSLQLTSADEAISSQKLLGLLDEIRKSSEDSSYWEDVMEAVPAEEGFGLSVPEVAEAVYVWLRDFVQSHADDGDDSQGGVTQVGENLAVDTAIQRDDFAREDDRDHRKSFVAARCMSPQDCTGRTSFTTVDTTLADVHRIAELAEVIGRASRPEDVVIHQALSRLASLCESMERGVQSQEIELSDLRERNECLTKQQAVVGAELEELQESRHDIEDLIAERDEHRRRADAAQHDLRELQEHQASASAMLVQQKSELEQHRKELADTHQRDMQWKERFRQLQNDVDHAEGRAQWASSELDKRSSQLQAAQNKIDTLTISSESQAENAALLEQQQQAAATKGSLDECERALQARSSELAALKQEHEESLREIVALRREVQEHHGIKLSCDALMLTKDSELADLRVDIADRDARISALEHHVEEKESALRSTVDAALADLKLETTKRDAKISEMHEQIELKDAALRLANESRRSQRDSQISAQEALLAQHKMEIAKRDAKISEIQEQIELKDSALRLANESRRAQRDSQISVQDAMLAEMKVEIAKRDSKILEIQKQMDEKDSALQRANELMNTQLSTRDAKISEIQKQLEAKDSGLRRANQRLSSQNDRVSITKQSSEFGDAAAELDRLKREIAQRNERLKESTQKIASLEKELFSFRETAVAPTVGRRASNPNGDVEGREAGPAVESLRRQLEAQQVELDRLRQVRDELLNASASEVAGQGALDVDEDDSDVKYVRINEHRKNAFLQLQLKSIMRYVHEMERLLNSRRVSQLDSAPLSAESIRRLSIQKVQEDGTALFNELSEQLYTFEVQKSDADRELGRLQQLVTEQAKELEKLRDVAAQRDSLLLELDTARSFSESTKASTYDSRLSAAGTHSLGVGGDGTSDTCSMVSGHVGDHKHRNDFDQLGPKDTSVFLWGGSGSDRGVPLLKSSPKHQQDVLKAAVRNRTSSHGAPQQQPTLRTPRHCEAGARDESGYYLKDGHDAIGLVRKATSIIWSGFGSNETQEEEKTRRRKDKDRRDARDGRPVDESERGNSERGATVRKRADDRDEDRRNAQRVTSRFKDKDRAEAQEYVRDRDVEPGTARSHRQNRDRDQKEHDVVLKKDRQQHTVTRGKSSDPAEVEAGWLGGWLQN